MPSAPTRNRFPWRLGDELHRAVRTLEPERDDPIAGQGLDRDQPGADELAPEELLEGRGEGWTRRAEARGVEPRDVGLRGDEQARGARGAEELERERTLGVDPHVVHSRAGERGELADDGVDLGRGEGHDANFSTPKMQRPPEGGRGAQHTRS